jgi:hypothetical protein
MSWQYIGVSPWLIVTFHARVHTHYYAFYGSKILSKWQNNEVVKLYRHRESGRQNIIKNYRKVFQCYSG